MVSIYWQGDDPFPLKSWLQVTYPLLKAASFDTFCLIAPQPQEIQKEVQFHNNSSTRLPTSHQPRFYAAPNFLKMRDKLPKSVIFWTILTIKDEKSATSLYKNCQRQSCSAMDCLSSGINISVEGRPLRPEILAENDPPLPEGSEF